MFDASPRPELLALLAAVKAEPDDDTVKLVLADWLQEQDTEADRARGEWLRSVVRHRSLPLEAFLERGELWQRIRGLWEHYHPAWLGPLPAAGFRFRDFHQTSRWGLFDPSIDGTQAVTKAAQEVTGSEAYAWVAGLRFDRISNRQLSRLADSPLLDSLAGLTVGYCSATTLSLAEVIRSPRVAGLRSLALESMRAGGAPLGTSPHLGRLRSLFLKVTYTGDTGFKALCDSEHLNELRSLTVHDEGLTGHSGRAFAEATGLPALTELDLGGRNRLGPEGALMLVMSPNAGRLRRLNLASNAVTDYAAESIAGQRHLAQLTHLDLSHNDLTNRAAVALAAAPYLTGLEELNLSGNRIAGMGAGALANSPHLANLRRLDLSGNPIDGRFPDYLRERFGTRVVLD